MEEFKIGARVACYFSHGSYSEHWGSPEVILRETKTLWITDRGSKFYKNDRKMFGSRGESLHSYIYYIWTTEMEIKRQQTLLRKSLEQEMSDALKGHKFSVTQLQYMKKMLEN